MRANQDCSDLPVRSGMGSSSSCVFGLLGGLLTLKGVEQDKKPLLRESLELWQNIVMDNMGAQDQTAAVYGGFNRMPFHPDGQVHVLPVTVGVDRLQDLNGHLMLF